jgi:hypothetical protein
LFWRCSARLAAALRTGVQEIRSGIKNDVPGLRAAIAQENPPWHARSPGHAQFRFAARRTMHGLTLTTERPAPFIAAESHFICDA